ncbi:aminodeoxychorismate synthase component I [uncultured Robinsoniella sp.]|uniref:aminodeoxychorismate synthase component I n=1 Tax=uncultured Robinsoniella sp. TaxID=904190 RepID=UPI00374FAC9A
MLKKIQKLEPYIPIQDIHGVFQDQKDTAFLHSSLQNKLGRYSIIGLYPYLKLVKGESFTVNAEPSSVPFEQFMRNYLKENREENTTGLPLISGAIGYFSYDYGRKKEGVKAKDPIETDIPDCILNFYDVFIIEDHENREVTLVANGKLKDSSVRLEELKKTIFNGIRIQHPAEERKEIEVIPNFKKEEYLKAIDDMIGYIIEGDIYIANMTQRLTIKNGKAPYEVFRKLRVNNPSPFGGYLNYGDFQVICASPERFLQMKKGHVETRPIKGTRKRGSTPEEDQMLKAELEASQKDKSELLMIVDLERNDLNRVCRHGSVQVNELFTVEEYATVFHLVSNITGDLKPGMTVMDLIEAAFPGGSITGAPKLRAMEIIDELEHGRRGLYTGSIGYLTLDGDCDFNIVIRTAVHKDGIYQLGVGGGITYESELEFEYEETLQKAKAILECL